MHVPPENEILIVAPSGATKQDKIPATGFNRGESSRVEKAVAVKMMKQIQKFDERFERGTPNLQLLIGRNRLTNQSSNVDGVVEATYTTPIAAPRGSVMAFVRRKGNSFFLVHNVRRGGKVRQLHLARLGMNARITAEVVREVSKKHPFIEVNWNSLREQLNGRRESRGSRLSDGAKTGFEPPKPESRFGGCVSAAIPNFWIARNGTGIAPTIAAPAVHASGQAGSI